MADKPIQLVSGKLTQVEATVVSTGAGEAGDVVALDSSGKLDISVLPTGFGTGVKWEHYVASLSSYDKVCDITYIGTDRLKRIDSLVYSSVLFPDSDITVDVDWLDVGLKNQRIDKIDISGAVFSPNTIRKTFNYVLDGTKYFLSDYSYALL